MQNRSIAFHVLRIRPRRLLQHKVVFTRYILFTWGLSYSNKKAKTVTGILAQTPFRLLDLLPSALAMKPTF